MNQQTKPDPMDRAPVPFKPIVLTEQEAEAMRECNLERQVLPHIFELAVESAKQSMVKHAKKSQVIWDSILKKYGVDKSIAHTLAFDGQNGTIKQYVEDESIQ